MSQTISHKKQVFTSLLVVLFLGYLVCTWNFTHTHIINGKVVVHSHPYCGGTSDHPAHTHTFVQFQTIVHLSNWFSCSIFASILIFYSGRGIVRNIPDNSDVCCVKITSYSLRAPPVSFKA